MPDISMCWGTDCHLKEDCYRYKAKANELYQTYFSEPPLKGDKCDYHWKIDEKVKLKLDKNQIM